MRVLNTPRLFSLMIIALCLSWQPALAQPNRSQPPPVGETPALSLPTLQSFTLSNGLSVWVMEKHQVPIVQMNLFFEAGRVQEGPAQYGLASLTAALLDEGAGDRSALELADALEFLGARFQIDSGDHSSSIQLRVPIAHLEEALGLMADVLLRPAFDEAELDRLRTERLTELLSRHDEPNAIADELFYATLFGPEHPYGRANLGTEAALRSLSTAEVRNFYERYYRPDNANLVVVGDVTPADLLPRLEAAFGMWEAQSVPAVAVPEVAQVEGRMVYLVDKPGAAQSVVLMGHLGVARDTEDYYALEVLNTILGGSFTSRLNQNLREDKGYTYGARSNFDYRRAVGPFVAGASVQTEVTGPSLAEFMKELQGILEPISAEEIERAKNFLAMRFPAGFQSVSQVAGRLANLLYYDLPLDYFNHYTANILAVSEADVARVASTYLDPENLAIVIVGDRAVIEAQVQEQGLGPIKFLSITDVLGPAPNLSGNSD